MTIEQIWSRYRDGLKTMLSAKVSNPTEVDDLLQEILLKTYQNIDSIRSDASIQSWLYRVASNTLIDFYRRQAAVREISGDTDFAAVMDSPWHNDPQDDITQSLARCIVPFINALPKETAQLLIAIDIEGEAQKRYAQKNGIHYSTLKSRVHKARHELRQLFDQCCAYSLDQRGNLIDFNPKSGSCNNC